MRIFNQDKTVELTEYDLEKGYLKSDFIEYAVAEQSATAEQYHYETVKEYKNGGKDVKKVIDVPGKPYIPAHVEKEEIQVYIPYTEKELEQASAKREICELKALLSQTDYKAIKFAEGMISAEQYAPDKAQRQAWRERIGELEAVIGGQV